MKNTIIATCILFASAASGAAQAPAPASEADSLPQMWTPDREFFQPSPVDDQWWDSFADATLRELINRGVANNYNLFAASRRIEMAENVWKQARSAYFPTLSANAGWQRAQSAGAVVKPSVRSSVNDYFSLGISMNWEIDVFGRVAAQAKADKASYNASLADYDAVMVSLCANIAKAYINLRTAQQQKLIAQSHLASQEKILKIAEARLECGLASMLDVRQARIVVLSTKASLPALDATITSALNSLALLCGCYSENLPQQLLVPVALPPCPTSINIGVPANILRRRPDIVEAEMQLASYAAQVGVAKKDFLPVLSLQGSIATESHPLCGLFGKNSLSYSVAPTLSWTIFDGLARNYRVAEAKARMEEAIDNYNFTVATAVEETRNAIGVYKASVEEMDLERATSDESEEAVKLALDRYRQGLTDFTPLADAQLTWLEYRNALLTSHSKALVALVNLYQALGGGWQQDKQTK